MKKKSAFTLVELMVAMAIIGVLLGLAIYGVTAAQRASRDTERKAALQDINIGVQDLIDQFGMQPVSIHYTATTAKICGDATCTTHSISVTLKNSAVPSDTTNNVNASATTTSVTRYAFGTCTSGFYLGACLEANNTPYNVGTCTTAPGAFTCP